MNSLLRSLLGTLKTLGVFVLAGAAVLLVCRLLSRFFVADHVSVCLTSAIAAFTGLALLLSRLNAVVAYIGALFILWVISYWYGDSHLARLITLTTAVAGPTACWLGGLIVEFFSDEWDDFPFRPVGVLICLVFIAVGIGHFWIVETLHLRSRVAPACAAATDIAASNKNSEPRLAGKKALIWDCVTGSVSPAQLLVPPEFIGWSWHEDLQIFAVVRKWEFVVGQYTNSAKGIQQYADVALVNGKGNKIGQIVVIGGYPPDSIGSSIFRREIRGGINWALANAVWQQYEKPIGRGPSD